MVGSICTWIFRVGAGSPALMRTRGLCSSRHEGRDVAASGLLPAWHAVARSCAARELSELRGAQGRHAVGSGEFRVHVVVRGLRAGAGQGDADRQCGQAAWRARHALVADRRAYVWRAVEALDLSQVRRIAADETSARRGHDYVSLFVDMARRKVI